MHLRLPLKATVRALRRNPGDTLVKGLSLTVGFACVLLIALHVQEQRSYDDFHAHADRVYRVATERLQTDGSTRSAQTPRPLGPALARTLPDVAAAARLSRERAEQVLARQGTARDFEERVFFADPSFFDVFSVDFVRGEASSALARPRTIVLTEAMAQKYFGDADPMGQTLTLRLTGDRDTFDYEVTGVVRAFPPNAHFHFDALAAYQEHPLVGVAEDQQNWRGLNLYTYVLLRDGAEPDRVESQLTALVRWRDAGDGRTDAAPDRPETSVQAVPPDRLFLQPLTDIHLHSHLRDEIEPNGNATYVTLLGILAVFVLLLAAINFVNLATARAVERAREVGIRKALGAQRWQLVGQFLAETMLVSAGAFVLALGAARTVLPFWSALAGQPLTLRLFEHGPLLGGVAALALATGAAAGLYPALVLAAFQPGAVSDRLERRMKGPLLRRGLVVVQFAAAIGLVLVTVVMGRQVRYMQHRALGFDEEHVLVVEGTEGLGGRIEAFKRALDQQPGIRAVSNAQAMPGHALGRTRIGLHGRAEETGAEVAWLSAGYDYASTLGLDLVAGRDFDRAFPSDSMAVLLNQAAADALGLHEPVGAEVVENDRAYTVVGVVADFHYASLHRAIGPLAIFGPDPWSQNRPNQLVVARLEAGRIRDAVAAVERVWTQFVPQQPLAYSFLDRSFDAQYRNERRQERVFAAGTGIALAIAVLGLVGLMAFTAQRRTKEIGMRRVLGATVPQVVALLSADVVRLVVLALVLAMPLGYVTAHHWLERFAYRVDLGPGLFLAVGGVALALALLTVSVQAIRAATVDPAQVLRDE